MLTRRTARRPNQTTHRVHEQIDVREIVHVRLHREGVTAPSQRLARLFSRDRMAALHYQLANLGQQLGTHQTHVVHHRLVLVLPLVPDIGVPQKLAKHVLLEKRKQPGAGLLVGIEMLEAQQQRRNVVSKLQVDPEGVIPGMGSSFKLVCFRASWLFASNHTGYSTRN